MRKEIAAVCVLVLGCLVAVPAALANTTEFVYVESNVQSPNGNSIFAFKRNADGSLMEVPGSPFLTRGAGVQTTAVVFGPYDTDQNLVVDSQRRLLFAVNSGSDTIAVFHINSKGSLIPVAGSPFPSGGTDPVSLGVAGEFLFVVNSNGDLPRVSNMLPNYKTFHIAVDGSLSPVNGSEVKVALGSNPSQALVAPGGSLLFGADFFGGLLQSFRIDSEGRLHQRLPTALPDSEFTDPAVPHFPLGLITHPSLPLLYVGEVTNRRLAVYDFDSSGKLSFIRSVPNSGTFICWLRTNRRGTRLYTSNQGSFTTTSTISVYDLTDPREPREIQSATLAGNTTQIELSADGRNLFAVSQHVNTLTPPDQGKALHVFAIAEDGTLSETSQIPFNVPAGAEPQGVAVLAEQ